MKKCLRCGKPVEGNRKYCPGECAHESHKEKMRRYIRLKKDEQSPGYEPAKRDRLEQKIIKCKEEGISYAEYQKRQFGYGSRREYKNE